MHKTIYKTLSGRKKTKKHNKSPLYDPLTFWLLTLNWLFILCDQSFHSSVKNSKTSCRLVKHLYQHPCSLKNDSKWIWGPLAFILAPPGVVDICCFEWHVSTTVRGITMQFGTNTHVVLRVICNYFGEPFHFSCSAIICSKFWLTQHWHVTKYQQN